MSRLISTLNQHTSGDDTSAVRLDKPLMHNFRKGQKSRTFPYFLSLAEGECDDCT